MVYTYHYQSPLGGITLSSDGSSLTGLWFDGQKYFGDTLPEVFEESCRCLRKLSGGLTFILVGERRILRRRFLWRQHHFVGRYGKSCLKFLMGKL